MAASWREGKTLLERDRIRVAEVRRKFPDGSVRRKAMVALEDVCIVIPVKSNGKLIVERHYRYSVDRWLYEFPAGKVEKGERPEQCAAREFEEETGYRAKNVRRLASFYVMPGRSNYMLHVCLATGLSRGKQALEGGEFLTIGEMSSDKMMRLLKSGKLLNQKTATALLYYNTFVNRKTSHKSR